MLTVLVMMISMDIIKTITDGPIKSHGFKSILNAYLSSHAWIKKKVIQVEITMANKTNATKSFETKATI